MRAVGCRTRAPGFTMLASHWNPTCAGLLLCLLATAATAAGDFYEGPEVSAAAILRARGYQADELYLTTSSGYRLRMTRGRNPLFGASGHLDSKQPVLFVHGALAAANNFLVNSFGAEPKDFTRISLTNSSLSELNALLADEPSARALPLLALNFGHEVWLVDRRPVSVPMVPSGPPASNASDQAQQPQRPVNSSRQSVGERASGFWDPLASYFRTVSSLGVLLERVPQDLNARYWNFSLDEQALEDFPEMVDYVLEQTGSARVALVTHSAGGALALMAQSLQPERLASKLSSAIYWAPAFSIGNGTPLTSATFAVVAPVGSRIDGPLPPTSVAPLIQASLSLLCANPVSRATLCRALLASFFGDGGGLEPALPQLVSSLFYPDSSHALAQLGQQVQYEVHTMHKFDYGRAGNQRAYGQPVAPRYELARVLTRRESMSIYVGSTDGLVAPASVRLTASELGGNFSYKEIDETAFSHIGYFFNTRAPRQVIIPSMRELETLAIV